MEKVFNIVPASGSPYLFIWIIVGVVFLIFIGVTVMLASFGYQARHATFTMNDQGLRIGPGLYGRFIPKDQIDTAGVRTLDLTVDTQYKPRWRTNGAGLPGYSAGWFKLENQQKALLFVTDKTSIVYIPTTANYSIMLSVPNAGEFADVLRHW
jgi:hypothetical protein